MMQEFKPNSHRFKEQQELARVDEKRVEKVSVGAVKTKKKNQLGKVAGIFISDDVHNVGEYLLTDVLVPTLKKAALGALDMILNGGAPTYTGRSNTSKVSYRRYYDEPTYARHDAAPTARPRFDYDDIIFETRGDAEAVLEEMRNIIVKYDGFVTVADMYDLVDISQPYTSNKYGWTSLRSAEVVRTRDGYILKLPKVMAID